MSLQRDFDLLSALSEVRNRIQQDLNVLGCISSAEWIEVHSVMALLVDATFIINAKIKQETDHANV
jgi:hypothetical protein